MPKMRKRPNGQWRGRVDGAPHLDGSRRQVTISESSKDAANKAMRKVQEERAAAKSSSRCSATLGDYAQTVMASWSHDLAEKTVGRYQGIIDNHILNDPISKLSLPDTSEQVVRDWKERLWAKPGRTNPTLAPRSVMHCLKLLRKILKTACDRGEINSNPARNVPNPRVDKGPDSIRSWDVDEVKAFMGAATASTSLNAEMWKNTAGVAISTGIRREELLGLKWSDIDLVKGTLTVARARIKPGTETKSPKTRTSSRTISLGPEAVSCLTGLRDGQGADRSLWGAAWTDTGFVVVLPDGTPPRPDSVTRRFQRDCEQFGIRYVTWQGLRHTYATLSLMAGVPLHLVSSHLGHSNPGITLDFYAHVLPRSTTESAVKADKYIFGGR
jgi:integrase